MPYNYFLAPLIAKVFPRGKIIHCRRHPIDTCLSCYFQNFTGGSEFYVRPGGTRQLLSQLFTAHGALARRTCKFPCLRSITNSSCKILNPPVRAMLEFCGLDWEESCLKFHKSKRAINTASYQQVRKPIYTRSAGRWKNYEKHLGPLIDALQIDPDELE